MDMMQDVVNFHVKFDHGAGLKPRVLPTDLFTFRSGFHHEEINEYDKEQEVLEDERLKPLLSQNADVIIAALDKQLDALCDAAWVILGTAEVQFGADRFREAWRRVVVANMAKVRSDAGVEGCVETGRIAKFDIVKPPGWTAPNHKDLVWAYAPLDRDET